MFVTNNVWSKSANISVKFFPENYTSPKAGRNAISNLLLKPRQVEKTTLVLNISNYVVSNDISTHIFEGTRVELSVNTSDSIQILLDSKQVGTVIDTPLHKRLVVVLQNMASLLITVMSILVSRNRWSKSTNILVKFFPENNTSPEAGQKAISNLVLKPWQMEKTTLVPADKPAKRRGGPGLGSRANQKRRQAERRQRGEGGQ